MDKTKNYVESLKSGKRFSVTDLEAHGVIFCRVEGFNRAINSNHVKNLIKGVKKLNRFLQPIQVISAEEYFGFYPDRTLVSDGKAFTKDSTEISRIMLILDGQHRYNALLELKQEKTDVSSLEVEYVDLHDVKPDEWMVEINTQSRNWTSKDRTSHILALIPGDESNIAKAHKWQEEYGMGERAAYAILTFSDTYKKSCQVDYMNGSNSELPDILKGTAEQRKRGERIIHAFEVGFRRVPKMLKNMAAIKLAIDKYNLASDSEKEKIVNRIVLFFMTLDQTVAKNAALASGVTSKLDILGKEWTRVSELFKTDVSINALEEQAKTAEADWTAIKGGTQKAGYKKSTNNTDSILSHSNESSSR